MPSVRATMNQLVPTAISGTNSWHEQAAYDYSKAFDGKTDTYFDGLKNGYVQADLGSLCNISAFGYCGRNKYEYRMTDGMIQVSEDGKNWKTVHTITNLPAFGMQYVRCDEEIQARYVRFVVPDGVPANGYNHDDVYNCNIAELEIYGEATKPVAGDVNADGRFTLADLILFQQYLVNQKTELPQRDAADMNADDVLNIFDLALMKRIYLQ